MQDCLLLLTALLKKYSYTATIKNIVYLLKCKDFHSIIEKLKAGVKPLVFREKKSDNGELSMYQIPNCLSCGI